MECFALFHYMLLVYISSLSLYFFQLDIVPCVLKEQGTITVSHGIKKGKSDEKSRIVDSLERYVMLLLMVVVGGVCVVW